MDQFNIIKSMESNIEKLQSAERPIVNLIVAAPLKNEGILRVTGEDVLWGKWKEAKGDFRLIMNCNNGWGIFQSEMYVPETTGFKFVYCENKDKLEWEKFGWEVCPNRNDELLSGTHFFIAKFPLSLWPFSWGYKHVRAEVMTCFIRIVFKNIVEKLNEWENNFDFLTQSMNAFKQMDCATLQSCYSTVINDVFTTSPSYDNAVFPILCAAIARVYPPALKQFAESQFMSFSSYLSNFLLDGRFVRNANEIRSLFGNLALNAGPKYWWLLFRLNYPNGLRNLKKNELVQSLTETLQRQPELLLCDDGQSVGKVFEFLFPTVLSIGGLYEILLPIKDSHPHYAQLIDSSLLKVLFSFTKNLEQKVVILKSKFFVSLRQNENDWFQRNFNKVTEFLFKNESFTNLVKLAIACPGQLRPEIAPGVLESIKSKGTFSFDSQPMKESRFLVKVVFESDDLMSFPSIHQTLMNSLLLAAKEKLKEGNINEIPSLKLLLMTLVQADNLVFLEQCSFHGLRACIYAAPKQLFSRLRSMIGDDPEERLTEFMAEYGEIVKKIMIHFDACEEICDKVKARNALQKDISIILDNRVLECLQSFGLHRSDVTGFREDVHTLERRRNQYQTLYQRLRYFNDIEVLQSEAWEEYLEALNTLALKDALKTPSLLKTDEANWLEKILLCPLFEERIWNPLLKHSTTSLPMNIEDFNDALRESATQWKEFAQYVSEGSVTLQSMDAYLATLPQHEALSTQHLDKSQFLNIRSSYLDFERLQSMRYLINPFISVLQYFKIKDRAAVENLATSVNNTLLSRWDEATLKEARQTGIIDVLEKDFGIDPERPETKTTMQFISSLISEDGRSPLIEWIQKQKDQDMEAMGRLLQGSLLEAYGMLQTLKTRIAPFLDEEFTTYQELVSELTKSEKKFAEKTQRRVEPIRVPFLVNSLPDIEASIRASIISPYEDAKEKISQLSTVCIRSTDVGYTFDIKLTCGNDLRLEELKHAFQLLELSAPNSSMDDTISYNENWIFRVKETIVEIFEFADVFKELYASGCISYTFRSFEISLSDLEPKIREMKNQLTKWNDHWVLMNNMPYLSVLSRDYLLYFADTVYNDNEHEANSILRIFFPSIADEAIETIKRLATQFCSLAIGGDWIPTERLFQLFEELNLLLEKLFHASSPTIQNPPFINAFGLTLSSYFIDRPIQILNTSQEMIIAGAIAAYVSIARCSIKPTRLLFVTAETTVEAVNRFMTLWTKGQAKEIFIMVHVERLTDHAVNAIKNKILQVPLENTAWLLFLAQECRVLGTARSLGLPLGIPFDQKLEVNFTTPQLRDCLESFLPRSDVHFFISDLPGSGKSQLALQHAKNGRTFSPKRLYIPSSDRYDYGPDYYRIPVRNGTVDELLTRLRTTLRQQPGDRLEYLHLDVGHSASCEFNDILFRLIVHGAVFDPQNAKLKFWTLKKNNRLLIELASPFSSKNFPIIDLLGTTTKCKCDENQFTYDLAEMPVEFSQSVTCTRSAVLVTAAKFLDFLQKGSEGIVQWDRMCKSPGGMLYNPPSEIEAFRLLQQSFQQRADRQMPTFTLIYSMASFISKHVNAMASCFWFRSGANVLFENAALAEQFKVNVFNLLLKSANDTVSPCWNINTRSPKESGGEWSERQRAMLLLGCDQNGSAVGLNIVGLDKSELNRMFHQNLLETLKRQSLHFIEMNGFTNLLRHPDGAAAVINAVRSLLQLDGSPMSREKVMMLDNNPNLSAKARLNNLVGDDKEYILTGDGITKMMFSLYKIRCGLPVIAIGEAGVGKTALFRFMIKTLLGHEFRVCNVNSGTTIKDLETVVNDSLNILRGESTVQVFVFFDELNTADPEVIAFIKELMLDRHFNGRRLPNNLHLLGAANPWREKPEADREAEVGLSFRFAQSSLTRSLVYRVNPLPLAFYSHIYDFGNLSDGAEDTYIEEMSSNKLSREFAPTVVHHFIEVLRKSHKAVRRSSSDPLSAVSLRDAARALSIFHWFKKTDAGRKIGKDTKTALELTIYLVYAFRFTNIDEKTKFLREVFGKAEEALKSMRDASMKIARKLHENICGASMGANATALNNALCENLFALYVCVLNGIFVIVVGRPGSSKSLSVEILKLVLGPGRHQLRKSLGGVPALTELYFQCSPLSTSSGFKALFDSAQRFSNDSKLMLCMVVLDELGLADLSPERPVKVLHSELERQSHLTSGETRQAPFSVVALSNWIVDRSIVNRGIIVRRQEAANQDLLASARELAHALLKDYSGKVDTAALDKRLEWIVDLYHQVDGKLSIGGGHFYSMRDFFFCVKNFVCCIMGLGTAPELRISNDQVIRSVVRNFGGHDEALRFIRESVAPFMDSGDHCIPDYSPIDLILENIHDSAKPMSIHVARHLMILNRSMIGLQLLNHYIRKKLDPELGWTVIFGSCFPGDRKNLAVTRKLRRVEQAIRIGGVIVLCHANQLWESLYMVLNQTYFQQGDATMTQIALGPSTKAIPLPRGPFRIIALQNTDAALNKQHMSPAVLSRFEKRELKTSYLLNLTGKELVSQLCRHQVWSLVDNFPRRRKLLYGYHEETFSSLALKLQNDEVEMEIDNVLSSLHKTWMRAVNPMEMLKLEHEFKNDSALSILFQEYRESILFSNLQEILDVIDSKRLVVMTNTHCHVTLESTSIRLFDIQTEVELFNVLDALSDDQKNDSAFTLFIQYDAFTEPIEQFQLAKYEIDTRFQNAECRVVFIVHITPLSSSPATQTQWTFSFGDGWEYGCVDELFPVTQFNNYKLLLKSLICTKCRIAAFIEEMTEESFRSLLLELLGPDLQPNLINLRSSLGQFYRGIRTALGLPEGLRLVRLLKECLISNLDALNTEWKVIDSVDDPDFDSSSSLSEALWGVFKHRLCNSLSSLLVFSDISKVTQSSLNLWCDFLESNYENRLFCNKLSNSSGFIAIPAGYYLSTAPFSRILFHSNWSNDNTNTLSKWLGDYLANSIDINLKKQYFRDWMAFKIPPHLHQTISLIPFDKLIFLIKGLFTDMTFQANWKEHETDIINALELMSIAAFTCGWSETDFEWDIQKIRTWRTFKIASVKASLSILKFRLVDRDNRDRFLKSITSIEISDCLHDLITKVDEESSNLLLGLRIAKRLVLFDPNCVLRFPDMFAKDDNLLTRLSTMAIDLVVRPKLVKGVRRSILQSELYTFLNLTISLNSPEEVADAFQNWMITQSRNTNMNTVSTCPEVEIIEDNENEIPCKELFHEYQKFLYIFEQIVELVVNYPNKNTSEFLTHLIEDRRLTLSWRFMTVITRCILETPEGGSIVNSILAKLDCNHISNLLPNAVSFLRALVFCVDDAARSTSLSQKRGSDISVALLSGKWTVERIRQLATIRQELSDHFDQDLILETLILWYDSLRRTNDRDEHTALDAFLFFVLRFVSGEGDETLLSRLFRDSRIKFVVENNSIVKAYIDSLSPFALGFQLLPVNGAVHDVHNALIEGRTGEELDVINQDYGPLIRRLAVHLSDIAGENRIDILGQLVQNPWTTNNYHLPGVDEHVDIDLFRGSPEKFRWYVCPAPCNYINYVGNCGRLVVESICNRCSRSLTRIPGVRQATLQDFRSPTGFLLHWTPSACPAYRARNVTAIVTRFCQLLLSLAITQGVLTARLSPDQIDDMFSTIPDIDRPNVMDRQTLLELLLRYTITSLNVFFELHSGLNIRTTITDRFKAAHLLLNRLSETQLDGLTTEAAQYAQTVQARERFELAITDFLSNHDYIINELQEGSRIERNIEIFKSELKENSQIWIYQPVIFVSRRSILLELTRAKSEAVRFPFLELLMDDVTALKLDALHYLGDAVRFLALVRTTLQRVVTRRDSIELTIGEGLRRIEEIVQGTPILLDRGHRVGSFEDIQKLFDGFSELWNRFSNIPNGGHQTFLDHFGCQEINLAAKPRSRIDETDLLVFVLAGVESPEGAFVAQLLDDAIAAASSVMLTDFVQPHCRKGSGRIMISCSDASCLSQFDACVYPHVPMEEVDRFIREHAIDQSTMNLAESYAMQTLLGSAGSTIAEDVGFDTLTEFVFQDLVETDLLLSLQKLEAVWKPIQIPIELQAKIVADLETNRSLKEAKSVLLSVIQFVKQNTEPLLINEVLDRPISNIISDLKNIGIITERHVSNTTIDILNDHFKVKVCHSIALLKYIMERMGGRDPLRGLIPKHYDVTLTEKMAVTIKQQLRSIFPHSIVETLRHLAQVVSNNEASNLPLCMLPEASLLEAVRQVDSEVDSISSTLTLRHLGHVLLIAESIETF